jgi:hypothetical protein
MLDGEAIPDMLYVILFLAYAFFPLVLAGYGAHIGAAGTRNKKLRGRQLLLIWGLAFGGVVVSGIAQYAAWHADTNRDTKEQLFRTQTLDKLNLIIAEPDSEKKKLTASDLKQQLEKQPSLQPTSNTSHQERTSVISANDISVVACNNPLKLNTEIHSSTKFDGPQDCTLIISSDSKVMLKNALLQIRVMPQRTVKINTVPPFTTVPDSPAGEIENELLQIPIVQTVAKGGVPFTVLLELPRSSKRYGLRFQIITDDGRMLGWWGVDIIPAHESG